MSEKAKSSPLAACDVFDTRISSAYISSTNNVSYQPSVFTALSELASVAARISNYINDQNKAIAERTVVLPEELKQSS